MEPVGRRCGASTWVFIALMMLALPVVTYSYKVLFLISFGTRSHKNVFDPIAEELGKRGHEVTIFSTYKENASPKGVTNVLMRSSTKLNEQINKFSVFSGQITNMHSWKTLEFIHESMCIALNESYSDPFVQDLILHPRTFSTSIPKYDVVVINGLFNEFNLALAQHLGVPIIYMTPSVLPPTVAYTMNIPRPIYVPNGMLMIVHDAMSFSERMYNFLTSFLIMKLRSTFQFPLFDARVREFLPNAPSISDIEPNISFVLSNGHFTVNPSAPSMPYHADIGGVHCKPAQKLTKDLEDFMQSSGDVGVIYMSFGSVHKGESIQEDMKHKFLKVFSELPQKVLWKYESEIKDLPKNIKLIDWAPQQDILGHPKMRLFISHAGGLSIQETSYHGKPVLAFPLGAEQFGNIGNAIQLGFGESLDWKTFTSEDLRDKIKRLLEVPTFTENAQKVSRLFRDRPQRAVELAAYWIEYVVRHNGAHHLKSGAEHLNFFQYFLLDVFSAIVIVLVVVASIIYFFTRSIAKHIINFLKIRRLTNRNRNSDKQTKQLNKDKLKIN